MGKHKRLRQLLIFQQLLDLHAQALYHHFLTQRHTDGPQTLAEAQLRGFRILWVGIIFSMFVGFYVSGFCNTVKATSAFTSTVIPHLPLISVSICNVSVTCHVSSTLHTSVRYCSTRQPGAATAMYGTPFLHPSFQHITLY